MAVAKKKKRVVSKPKPAPLPAAAPLQVQPQAEPQASPWAGRLRLIIWVAVIGFVAWKMLPARKPGVPGAPSASAPIAAPEIQPEAFKPGFGTVQKLDRISKFDAPKIVADIKALENGDVYLLHTDELALYRGGKQVKSLGLAGAPNRSMAFDGSSFWVTNSDNHVIERIGKDLVSKGSIQLPDASRLLGIAWLPGRQALAVAEVNGRTLYLVNAAGKVLKTASTSKPKDSIDGFAYDVQAMGDGGAILTDMYATESRIFGSDLKLVRTLSDLCSAQTNHRLGVLKGRLYLPCATSKAILVMAADGKGIGHLEVDEPGLAHGGADGALYVTDGNRVLKLKP